MRRYVILLLLFCLGCSLAGRAQSGGDREQFSYSVFYNWGIVWINGGMLQLSSVPDTLDGQPLVRLKGMGVSSPKWSWLFKLEDHYETWSKPGSFLPVKSEKKTLEGGYFVHNKYFFNYDDSTVYIQTRESKKPLSFDTLNLNQQLFDAQSAAGYLRLMDISGFQPGDTIVLNILMDGEVIEQRIEFGGKQILTDEHGNSYPVIKYTAVVTNSTLFSAADAINVWVSDDKHRIPLYIEAKISVGTIKVFYNGIRLEEG